MLRTIMNTAWKMFRTNNDFGHTFSECLKMAWAAIRGETYSVVVSTPAGRVIVAFDTFAHADEGRIAATRALVASGVKPFGSHILRVIAVA